MNIDKIAEDIVAQQYAAYPKELNPYGEKGYDQSVEDAKHNLKNLFMAVEIGNSDIFCSDMEWLYGIFMKRDIPTSILDNHLNLMREWFIASDCSNKADFINIIDLAIEKAKNIQNKTHSKK